MKLIKLFIITWAFSVQAGLPPTTLSGDQQTLKPTTFTALTPNNQATQVLGVQSRIETGNTNLLANPSFEHSTVTTGWTITNATGTVNTTEMVDGKKDLSLALSGAIAVTQDSIINAANLVGLQGEASIKIKSSDVTGLQVCPRNAGVTVTALCARVVSDGTWKHVTIPFIMTATSNGIAIISSGTTGTVKIDDAFVGTSAPFQNVSGAKLVGTITITGCIGPWSVGSTSIASFGFQSSCVYTTTGAALAPSTQIPAIKFASLPAGDYRLEYEGLWGTISSAAITGTLQFWDGVNTARETSSALSGGGASTITVPGISQSINYSSTQSNVTLEIRGKSSASTVSVYGTTAQPGVIKVWYFPPESKIYSQTSQDYDWTSYTPTLTGMGTTSPATNQCKYRRNGGDLEAECNFTTGTATTVLGSVSLPSSLQLDSSRIVNTAINTAAGQAFGEIRQGGASNVFGSIVANTGSSTLVVYTAQTTGQTGMLTPGNFLTYYNSGQVTNIRFKVPISGWSNSATIVGSFAGIEKCANDYECTDTFSAQISSTGVVSNENLDWINGNCTVATNIYTCPYNTNLKDGTSALSAQLNCSITTNNSSAVVAEIRSGTSTTQLQYETYVSTNGGASAQAAHIKCQKGTTDYKAKTAKVASSIGVPTVPGITTQAIDTFSVSYGTTNATTNCTASPCSYLDQIGSAVSSITRASLGTYSINTVKTYSKLKCTLNVFNSPSNYLFGPTPMTCSSCSSISFSTSVNSTSGGINDSFGTLICQGSY